MEEVYKKMGFIIGFLVIIFLLQLFDDKTAQSMTVLILVSMLLYDKNYDKLKNFVTNKFTSKEE